MFNTVKNVVVTGAAGQIAYNLLFRIASGEMLGKDQPISLFLHDIESQCNTTLKGVVMELEDGGYPLVRNINVSSDPYEAFKQVNYAILVGAKPRGPGMERKDLLQENASIFKTQGEALNKVASKDVIVFVVGNPCNTNCLIAMHNAPNIPRENFHAMTRLDQNRASFQLAKKANVALSDIKNVTIWGNHSSSLVPDFENAKISKSSLSETITDHSWLKTDFFKAIQQRGSEIIKARGKSSAASASQAIIDAIKDLITPTEEGRWFSSAICSDNNPYGIQEGLIFSFPCICNQKNQVEIVNNLSFSPFIEEKIRASEKELLEEKEMVKDLIN